FLNDTSPTKIYTLSLHDALPISYGIADGLLNTEFNGGVQASAWKTREGKLLFAGIRGIVEVNPNELHENLLPPPVIIEGVSMNGDRKSTRLNSSHVAISYAVFCL